VTQKYSTIACVVDSRYDIVVNCTHTNVSCRNKRILIDWLTWLVRIYRARKDRMQSQSKKPRLRSCERRVCQSQSCNSCNSYQSNSRSLLGLATAVFTVVQGCDIIIIIIKCFWWRASMSSCERRIVGATWQHNSATLQMSQSFVSRYCAISK